MLADYEIDLQMLEEMCSELEEPAMLLDKSMNICWMNAVLKDRLVPIMGEPLGSSIGAAQSAAIKAACLTLFGDASFFEDTSFSKVLSTGRFAKSSAASKKTFIPIKYGNDVVYVLLIIEHSLPEAPSQRGEFSPDSTGYYHNIARFFIESYNEPCFVSDISGNLIASNRKFDAAFKSELLRKLIFDQLAMSGADDFLKDLKAIVDIAYDVSRVKMEVGGVNLGYVYSFKHKAMHKPKNDARAATTTGTKALKNAARRHIIVSKSNHKNS